MHNQTRFITCTYYFTLNLERGAAAARQQQRLFKQPDRSISFFLRAMFLYIFSHGSFKTNLCFSALYIWAWFGWYILYDMRSCYMTDRWIGFVSGVFIYSDLLGLVFFCIPVVFSGDLEINRLYMRTGRDIYAEQWWRLWWGFTCILQW